LSAISIIAHASAQGAPLTSPTPSTSTNSALRAGMLLTWLILLRFNKMKHVSETASEQIIPYKLGWCWEREKIDWQEPGKFDCRLVGMIFYFLLSLDNFHKTLASGQKIKF